MRTLLLTLALTASLPALACNSFGPDFDPTPCPDVPVEPVPPPHVRIPLAPWTGPIDLGTNPDGSSRGIAVVSGMVIDDFAVLFAILPNSKKLIGVSAQCIPPPTPTPRSTEPPDSLPWPIPATSFCNC